MKIKSIEVLKEPKDVYCLEVDNDEHELVLQGLSGKQYRIGNCNFSLIYGCHWTSFVAMIQASRQSDLTEKEIVDMYNKFFDIHKGVKEIIENAKNIFMHGSDKKITRWVRFKNGTLHKMENKVVPFFTTCKTLLGRILTVDTERKLMNFPVQGSGSDTIKLAICRMGHITRKEGTRYNTINIVHDDAIGESYYKHFDRSSEVFRSSMEWAVNFILRRKFHTPVNQDFCVLSLLGEEILLEEAFTLKDIDTKLVERIQELVENSNNEEDPEKKTNLIIEANRVHKLLEKFRAKVKDMETKETSENTSEDSQLISA